MNGKINPLILNTLENNKKGASAVYLI